MEICPNCEEELPIKSPNEKESTHITDEKQIPTIESSFPTNNINKGNKGFKTYISLFIIIVLIAVILLYTASTLFLLNVPSNPENAQPVVTQTQNAIQTTITPHELPKLSCNIIGKWIQTEYQGSPHSGGYLQFYSDNRVEIYAEGQLKSWGPYEVIAPNKIRHTWAGGVDIGAGDTITISTDCQTLDIISFRGEHSTFVRA